MAFDRCSNGLTFGYSHFGSLQYILDNARLAIRAKDLDVLKDLGVIAAEAMVEYRGRGCRDEGGGRRR